MKLIFLIALLFNLSIQACTTGCLKCSKEDECQICDVIQFYKLTDKKCIQHKPDNCLLIDLSGNCLACEQNFYIEPQLKKCIEIGLANRTENCRLYDSKLNCSFCDEGFFIAGSVCKAQEKTIENCLYYQDQETCLECKPGSIVSIDKLTCESTASNSNCLKFSKVKCDECMSGYLYNELAYESQWFKSTSLFEKDMLMSLMVSNGFKTIEKQYVCQKQLVENCEEFIDLNTCKKCLFGYYLSASGQCIVNPFPSIQNCEVYQNRNSCSKCKQTYYRQSEISCIKVQDIPNCALYSQTQNTTLCLECQNQFYLNGTDKCIERENRVENCFEYEINLDVCKQCSESFVLTDDKLNCLNKIDNCQVYRPSKFETNELQCYKCDNGYHLNGKICEKGTIDNCEVYNPDSTHSNQICDKCKNQFVLNNQTCIQSQKIPDCSVYHPFTQNACQECLAQTQNILIGKVCVDQQVIANCEQYNQTGTTELQCSKCGNGYYLTDEFNCSEIQIENCIVLAEDDSCSTCKDGYFLWDDRCILRPFVHSTNCEATDYNDQKILSFGCQTCQDNFFPLDLQKSGICFEEDYIPTDKKIENCIQYDESDNFRCKLCKEGFVRAFSGGKYICSESCSTASKSIKRTIDDINKCLTSGDNPNCDILAYSYDKEYICTKCKTGYIQVLDKVYDSTLLYTMTNTSLFFNLFDDLQDKNFKVSCVAENTLTPSVITADCQYYQYVDTVYKCIKCKDFYTGTFTVNNSITSCTPDAQFTNKKIYNVDETYGIIQSGYQCSDDLEIPWLNMRSEASKGLCTVDISNLEIDYSNNLENRSNFCANPNIIDSSFAIPQNCGTILTKSHVVAGKCQLKDIQCQYCKPKFKPTEAGGKVTTCTFIDHCIGDNWFNACSKCENGYAFNYVSDNIEYDECVEYADNNCFAYSDSDEQCEICKYGYTLIKGVCELIVPQKCKLQSSFSFKSNDDYYLSVDRGYSNALKFNLKYFYNCQDCQQGFTSIVVPKYNFCIESDRLSQLYADTAFEPSDYYIQNCIRYNNIMPADDIGHTCEKCGNDLYAFNDECIVPLSHCSVVVEDIGGVKSCQTCIQGYGLQGNNCVVSEVSNCIENTTFNTCNICEQGYYKLNDKCYESQVLNCETVTNLNKCSKCFEGYLLYQTPAQDYCFPQPKDIKCKEGKIYQDAEFGAEVICESCPKVNQLLLSDIEANFDFKSICAPIVKQENCVQYNENRLFNINNFRCTECAEGYFLDNTGIGCKIRERNVDKCKLYVNSFDVCQECEEGYYIEEFKCVANPFGIQGCIVYETSDSCLQCETNKFSQDGLCYAVEEDNKIENCEVYKTGTLCETCSSGYFLQDNLCVKSQLQNCLEFESSTVCKQCADQYELKQEETKTSCQKVEKERCLKIDLSKENQPCLECEFLFFVNQTTGNCDEVPKENRVDNCLAYINDRECLKCDVGYVLSKDKLLCSKNPLLVNQIPDNCKNAKEEELFCSICKGGYIIKDGQCASCVENNWESGCYYCLTDYDGCYICRSGFIMNKDQKCVKDVGTDNTPEVTEVESGKILSLIMITLLILII